MSDYEYEDDYQFEYEDDGGAYEEGGGAGGTADPVVRIQNSYYQAKGLVANDPAAAKTHFQECLAAADEAGRGFQEWAFKSAKNLVRQGGGRLTMEGAFLGSARAEVHCSPTPALHAFTSHTYFHLRLSLLFSLPCPPAGQAVHHHR